MRKVIIALAVISLSFWCYYLYKNRNRFLYKTETVTDYTERVRLEKELDSLQEKYDYLYKLCSTDSITGKNPEAEPESDGKITELNREIGELKTENAELRRELDQRKAETKSMSNSNPRKSNEKNIPIARNSRAVELQKFLTELYGDR